MARFYGSMEGQTETEVTRTGGKSSGVRAHVRGWNVGARVVVSADGDKDVVRVYQTSGSNGRTADKLVAEFTS